MTTPIKNTENWELRRAQLEAEEKYKKLTPDEQKKQLAAEHQKFEIERKKAKEDLGYKEFDPAKKAASGLSQAELADQAKELAEAERLLTVGKEKAPDPSAKPIVDKSENLKDPEVHKKFLALFDTCSDNIEKKKPVPFPSMMLNDFGKSTTQQAFMTKLVDHHDKADLPPGQVYQNLKSGKTNPANIGLVVEIGKILPNELSLNKIEMEIPLAALLNGTFEEHLKNYTNMVFFTMLVYEKQLRLERQPKPVEKPANQPKAVTPPNPKESPTSPYKGTPITSIQSGGNVMSGRGALDMGDTSSITFACNSGSVWGTFDRHRAAQNPKELQDALDKIGNEK